MTAIPFRTRAGATAFAFDPRTDPLSVLVELAWAYAEGQGLCDWSCPGHEARYCLDCHATADRARYEAQQRMARAAA